MTEQQRKINWYPGHIAKAKRILFENVNLVDTVIEVVDSRLPVSSKDETFLRLACGKKQLIVFSKYDLVDKKLFSLIINQTDLSVPYLKLNLKDSKSFIKLKKKLKSLKANKILIVGLPNVGKSTLINLLSKGERYVKVGRKPGITRGIQWIKLKDFMVLDSPGVLSCGNLSYEKAIKFSLLGIIPESVFDAMEVAEYLISILKQSNVLKDKFELEFSETDNNIDILKLIARNWKFILKNNEPDIKRASIKLIFDFRKGKLGKFLLDN